MAFNRLGQYATGPRNVALYCYAELTIFTNSGRHSFRLSVAELAWVAS